MLSCKLSKMAMARYGIMKRKIVIALMLLGASATCLAGAISGAERKEILDAARPVVSTMVRQPIKFKVDHLNVDANWAVLVGELIHANGGPVDWKKAPGCHPDLDKMLWVVLAKADGKWRIAQVDVCASEPPYWSTGLAWPCGVYAGLNDGERDLERACRIENRKNK
jgi:hypothetical protein